MLRKITHIVLSMILLVSTTGISFSMHYCGGELISASVNTKAETCCDGSGGCCENKTIHVEIEDDYVCPVYTDSTNIEEIDFLFPILFVLHTELIEENIKANFAFNGSSSPPPTQTRLALLQTYLI